MNQLSGDIELNPVPKSSTLEMSPRLLSVFPLF